MQDKKVEGLSYFTDLNKVKFLDNGMVDMLGTMHDIAAHPDTVNLPMLLKVFVVSGKGPFVM